MNRVFIALGSNIDSERNLQEAVRRLASCCRLVAVSTHTRSRHLELSTHRGPTGRSGTNYAASRRWPHVTGDCPEPASQGAGGSARRCALAGNV